MRALALALLACALAAPLASAERSSAQAARDRPTSSSDQVSTKPLLHFSMRQRQDPFMAYALVTTTASTDFFSIANLFYSGLVQVQGAPVALFKDNAGQTYTLKGNGLHGPDNKRLAGIRGRVSAAGQVTLEQAEKKINYSTKSTSKRLDDGSPR
jgi:hypothetical protein